jgi:hypothetical protein
LSTDTKREIRMQEITFSKANELHLKDCRDALCQSTLGGVILKVEGDRGDLEILFVSPQVHSKGIGYSAWCEVERLHPEVKIWETVTPYFEKRLQNN